MTPRSTEDPLEAEFSRHMRLLTAPNKADSTSEIANTPIFTGSVKKYVNALYPGRKATPFSQHGLLAGVSSGLETGKPLPDPRLFYNVTTPASVFICGSQGSGKSHTLSCLLENCLLPSPANVLPRPLEGIVFHYDTFNSDIGGTPSEAAYLSSSPDIEVRVLCAPTNRVKIEKIYSALPNVKVSNFQIHESQLNTKRMLDLMAMGSVAGDAWPLYMHTVTRILRDMRLAQQTLSTDGFNYADFKSRLADEGLIGSQLGPLQQRLDALESFMIPQKATKTKLISHQGKESKLGKFPKTSRKIDTMWHPVAGRLTIVDLSCPCITDVTACSLFNVCLSLFLEQESDVGRVVALDEAHKYMKDSIECAALTESLLSAIRLQRHLAARIFISTQEPTISPKLLDLCSVTIVHRFTSPDWLNTLKSHLAGASKLTGAMLRDEISESDADEVPKSVVGATGNAEALAADIFARIVSLRTGEALLFAPNAAVGVRAAKTPPVLGSVTNRTVSGFADDSSESDADESLESDESDESDGDSLGSSRGTSVVSPSDEVIRLASGVLKICVRHRVTDDGGKSILSG